MLPYSCKSYKDVLKLALDTRKIEQPERRFTFQGMAAHCGIQKTYLSKVLNRDGHLNDDQLFDALQYLGFEAEETDFTLLLMSLEKAQSQKRKEILTRNIAEIRQRKIRTESNIKVQPAKAEGLDLLEYYIDPIYQIIHMCLTVRRFQQDPMKMAEVLRLSASTIRKYMKNLQKMQIIRYQESRGALTKVEVIRDNLHLPHDSVLHDVYASRMRLKALEQAERLDKSEAYRFSVLFSTDRKTRDAIHSSFMAWLKSVQKLVGDGAEEEVFQMNFDLLQWT